MDENTPRRPKVYVANKGPYDYSDAERYGELVFVTSGHLTYFTVNKYKQAWEEALTDSGPDDYIILGSLSILCAIGCAIFAVKHGRLNFLIYRVKTGKYISRALNFTNTKTEE